MAYNYIDIDSITVDLVLFGDLEFTSHIERQLSNDKNTETVIFESLEDFKKFRKQYNELYYK